MSCQKEFQGRAAALPSKAEELVNTLTHAIGLVLSIGGAITLIIYASSRGDAWRAAGCTVYAAALVAVYTTSTLSHIDLGPRLKRLFRTLDQGFIYLLISGTYTPFALAYLRTGGWWLLLGFMWAVALFGFFSKILFAHRVQAVPIWPYVFLGWVPIIAIRPLLEVVPAAGLCWMLVGGLCYTVGTVFLISDKRQYYFHAIWHVFVLAGSAFHFFAILFFVAPQTG